MVDERGEGLGGNITIVDHCCDSRWVSLYVIG